MSKKRTAFGVLRILIFTCLFVLVSGWAMSALVTDEASHSNGCKKAEIYYLDQSFSSLAEAHSNGCSTATTYRINFK